jgi:hypothetical protein
MSDLVQATAPASSLSWLDRRAALRFAINPQTSSHLVAALGDSFWPAHVLDISTRGIALRVRRKFEPDTGVLLELANGVRVFSCAITLRIRHVQPEPEGGWLIGGEFARKLTHHELMALLS